MLVFFIFGKRVLSTITTPFMQAVHRKTLMTSRDPRDRNGKHSPGREGARKFYMKADESCIYIKLAFSALDMRPMADESCIYYTCLLCLGHLRPKYAWKTHFVRRRSPCT